MSLNGIDIASHQGDIDVSSVPSDFVIVKGTEGTGYVNPYCDSRYQLAKSAGRLLGFYHFATGCGAIEEADYFINNCRGYFGESIPFLDWEADAVTCGPEYAKAFMDRVLERTGIKPMIYMSASVVTSYDWSSIVNGDYGLWIAGYYNGYNQMSYNPDAPMQQLAYWSDAAMYQYTSSGRLPSYDGDLDLNVFYGDGSAWNAYAGTQQQQPIPPKIEDAGDVSKANQNPVIPQDFPTKPSVLYQAHVANAGWQGVCFDGQTAGTVGQRLRMEALALESLIDGVIVESSGHVQNIGWQEYRNGKSASGTTGGSLRLEAVKIKLTGPNSAQYSVQYQVHVQNKGWMDWVKDGDIAGTVGESLRLEAIRIKIVKK